MQPEDFTYVFLAQRPRGPRCRVEGGRGSWLGHRRWLWSLPYGGFPDSKLEV